MEIFWPKKVKPGDCYRAAVYFAEKNKGWRVVHGIALCTNPATLV
jgi:hypothetical protein